MMSSSDPNPKYQNVPMSAVTFVETHHGRDRREQRGIEKKDLQRAMKYGLEEGEHWPGTIRYTYKDIVYIVRADTGEEVTCWANPIGLRKIKLKPAMIQEYEDGCLGADPYRIQSMEVTHCDCYRHFGQHERSRCMGSSITSQSCMDVCSS